MFGQHHVIALVPARGGSKGIPKKNLARLGDSTLLGRSIEVAQAVGCFDRVVVSTDDREIADHGRGLGAEAHMRPDELATDTSLVIDAIRHFADTMIEPDLDPMIILLEPTSPLRAADDVQECIRLLAEGPYDSVATFTDAELNPHRAWKITGNDPGPFIPGANPWLPRQKLPPAYQLNGAAYAFWRRSLKDLDKPILWGRIGAVLMPHERSLDIDDEVDLAVARAMLERS